MSGVRIVVDGQHDVLVDCLESASDLLQLSVANDGVVRAESVRLRCCSEFWELSVLQEKDGFLDFRQLVVREQQLLDRRVLEC